MSAPLAAAIGRVLKDLKQDYTTKLQQADTDAKVNHAGVLSRIEATAVVVQRQGADYVTKFEELHKAVADTGGSVERVLEEHQLRLTGALREHLVAGDLRHDELEEFVQVTFEKYQEEAVLALERYGKETAEQFATVNDAVEGLKLSGKELRRDVGIVSDMLSDTGAVIKKEGQLRTAGDASLASQLETEVAERKCDSDIQARDIVANTSSITTVGQAVDSLAETTKETLTKETEKRICADVELVNTLVEEVAARTEGQKKQTEDLIVHANLIAEQQAKTLEYLTRLDELATSLKNVDADLTTLSKVAQITDVDVRAHKIDFDSRIKILHHGIEDCSVQLGVLNEQAKAQSISIEHLHVTAGQLEGALSVVDELLDTTRKETAEDLTDIEARWAEAEVKLVSAIEQVQTDLGKELEAHVAHYAQTREAIYGRLDAHDDSLTAQSGDLTSQGKALARYEEELSGQGEIITRHTEEIKTRHEQIREWVEENLNRWPGVEAWTQGVASTPKDYAKDAVVQYRGGVFQALEDTNRAPGNDPSWQCLINGIAAVHASPSEDATCLQFEIILSNAARVQIKQSVPSINFLKTWSPDKKYKKWDSVMDDGHRWVAKTDNPVGQPSRTPEHWALLAMRGAQGRRGAKGEKGDPGITPSIERVLDVWNSYLESKDGVPLDRLVGDWQYGMSLQRYDIVRFNNGLFSSLQAGESRVPPLSMDSAEYWLPIILPMEAGGGFATDEFAGVTEDDTTPGYLSDKLQSADDSVTFSVLNPGGNEVLDLQATGEGGGETNLGSNVGGGIELYKGKNGVALEIRTVGSTASVVPTLDGDLLELTVQDGVVVPAAHTHDAFAGPGTTGFVPDPVTNTDKFLAESGAWQSPPVSPIGGIQLSYDWNSNIVASDPGSGYIKGNNVDHALITEIYVHDETRFGNDAHFVWASMHEGEILGIWDESGQAASWYGTLLANPVDNGVWHTLSVEVIPSTVGGMGNNDKVAVFPIHNPQEKIPVGGTTGQRLAKASDENFDAEWVDPPTGEGIAYSLADVRPFITIIDEGGTLYAEVEAAGGGDIRFLLSGTMITLDCTTNVGTDGKARVALTPGADANNPVSNAIYVINTAGDGVLGASVDHPGGGEWGWIGLALVPDATTFASTGPFVLQRFTEAFWHDGRGALSYTREKVRVLGAVYATGGDHTLEITVNGGAPDNVHLEIGSAVIYQMHRHTFPAFATGPYFYGNGQNQFEEITDLNAALNQIDGTSMSGTRFNLVVWGAVNETTGDCKVFVNLPGGDYNADSAAIADSDSTADYSVSTGMRTVSFLIARVALRHRTQSSGTWTELGLFSLLGQPVGVRSGGAGASASNDFADSLFTIYDNDDSTKQIALEAGQISASTTRIVTVPDADVTLALDGEKVPAGGTTGQALAKASDTNFDTEWVDQRVRKNLIINGSFLVQQRLQSSPTTSDHWIRDRWRGRRGADNPITIGNSVLGGYSMLVQRPASDSTTGTFRMNQQIEYNNFILLAGQKLTFSVRVRVEQTYLDTVPLDGDIVFNLLIYGGTVENENVDNVFGSFTGGTTLGSVAILKSDIVDETWHYFSVTTDDALSTGIKSIKLDFQSHYYGTSAAIEQFRIAQVQFEASEERTSFEYRSFGEELALSQRYYWTGPANGGEAGYRSMNLNSINGSGPTHSFPTTMRVSPTMTITGGAFYQCSTTAIDGHIGGFTHLLAPISTHAPYRCMGAIYYAEAEI